MGFSDSKLISGIQSYLGARASQQASGAAIETPSAKPPAVVSPPPAEPLPHKPEAPAKQTPRPYAHGAGVWVPPGTANGPIVIKDEGPGMKDDRSSIIAHPSSEKSLLPERVSLETIVSEFARAQRITTQRILLLGCASEKWISQQLAEKTALDRSTAIKKIRAQLAAAKLEKRECRVDLFIRCYWVARLFSGWNPDSQESRTAANSVAFSALRLFPLLIERDRPAESWRLIEKHSAAAKALWQRAVGERLSAAAIDEALSQIIPRRPVRRSAAVKLPALLKVLPRLSAVELDTLISRAQQERQRQALPAAA